ncbi:MAG: radical SAM protein [Clostridiales bacterium]|nr:radical SAM protein [Clostridiales bacterium]
MRELEIYIHIPFCVRKCGYCDFMSAPAKKEQRDRYVRTLLEEIRSGAPASALLCFSAHKDGKENSLPYGVPDQQDYVVTSVFFGGGTPSLLFASQIEEIMEALRERFYFSDHAEITIECNPGSFHRRIVCGKENRLIEENSPVEANGSIEETKAQPENRRKEEKTESAKNADKAEETDVAERAKMEAYLACGINRISFGLQSADDAELAALGRIHTFEMFLRSYNAARAAGFTNINVDLMSALPGQSVESWENTLRKVLALIPEHISAYSLIIEEGTPFYEKYHEDDLLRSDGEPPRFLPSEEDERQMTRLTDRILGEAGYNHYEISNYALPGFECRHNIGYWRGREYMGFGLGASSLLNHVRCKNPTGHEEYERLVRSRTHFDTDGLDPGKAAYSSSVNDMESSQFLSDDEKRYRPPSDDDEEKYRPLPDGDEESCQLLSVRDEMSEFMFLGLRMLSGVSEEEFFTRFGVRIDTVYSEPLERLQALELLRRENGRIFLTQRGLDLSNPVMAEFLL